MVQVSIIFWPIHTVLILHCVKYTFEMPWTREFVWDIAKRMVATLREEALTVRFQLCVTVSNQQ